VCVMCGTFGVCDRKKRVRVCLDSLSQIFGFATLLVIY
jgi:hypothetical protein